MSSDQSLSAAAQEVHRHDRERFVTALFAKPLDREGLLTLYAFNLEIARVREHVREAMAGMIRLQWWRDVLNGDRDEEAARHPVAAPLLALVRERDLPVALFDLMLTAREKDLLSAPFASQAEFALYAAQSAGALAELGAVALGARDDHSREAARLVGQAWAMVGLLRALPMHLGQGWLTLPQDLLVQADTTQDAVLAGQTPKAALVATAAELGRQARLTLASARRRKVARQALPVLLPATVASAHLRALERAGWDLFDSAVLRPRPMPLRLTVNALLGRF